MVELTLENAGARLRALGWLKQDEPAEVSFLGGGISNIVLRIATDCQTFVLKQALPRLRVAMEWQARLDRIFTERDALQAIGSVLPEGAVPRVLHDDPENYLFAMTCAPPDSRNWKTELLAGHVEPWVAERAGWMLGRIHRCCQDNTAIRERFADATNMIELRIDPYFVTVGRRHPDLQPIVDSEIASLLETKWTLVHGDYSPKNILIAGRGGETHGHLVLLDCEGAHIGHPAFDTAFCLNHFCLKSLKFPERKAAYLNLARRFWDAYTAEFATPRLDELSRRTVVQLGLMLLARVDGKSPVEYLTEPEEKERVRGIARFVLAKRPSDVAQALDLVGEWPEHGTRGMSQR